MSKKEIDQINIQIYRQSKDSFRDSLLYMSHLSSMKKEIKINNNKINNSNNEDNILLKKNSNDKKKKLKKINSKDKSKSLFSNKKRTCSKLPVFKEILISGKS